MEGPFPGPPDPISYATIQCTYIFGFGIGIDTFLRPPDLIFNAKTHIFRFGIGIDTFLRPPDPISNAI